MSRKKKKSEYPIYQVGLTTDNKIVVDGIWDMYETHGLPMDIILDLCLRKNWVPDWIALHKSMIASGMEHSRILSKLEEAINDSFGKEFCDVVISRLDQIFNPPQEHQ